MAAYWMAMRQFLALAVCAGLAWLAVGAVPYWANAIVASAVMHKHRSPAAANELALARCHINQSTAAVLLPLVLAWAIRVFSLRGEIWWMMLLRASMELILMVAAGWLVHFAHTSAHPLTALFIELCGPVPFLMK
ncbi:MAG: hypothetical protein FJW38_26855 [Acidobacteria bacterium]|nr:hypothetical protein [Acidobacteriota bacterium]